MSATPRPWKVDEMGSICAVWEDGVEVQVAVTAHTHWTSDHDGGKGHALNQRIIRETKANAALIVAACNSYDKLITLLQSLQVKGVMSDAEQESFRAILREGQ